MTAPRFDLLDPARYRRTPWKNGGGMTIDIAGAYRPGADPAGWEGMIWRFGRTRIERPGPFSDLSGCDRILAVVEGSGLMLHPRGREPLDVRTPFTPVRFPGEWQITSGLTHGPVGVINLIADRTLCAIDLSFPAAGAGASVSGARCIILALDDAVLDIGSDAVPVRRDFALSAGDTAALDFTLRSGRVAVAVIRARG
jgi:environmental stress-induced protein Ves